MPMPMPMMKCSSQSSTSKASKFTVDDLTDKAKELCGIVANGEKIVADLNIELLLLQAGLKPAVDGLEETLINEHEPLPESP